MSGIIAIAALLALIAPRVVQAQTSYAPMRFRDRPAQIAAMVGMGTPVGYGGFVVGYTLIERVDVGVGFGANGRGPQFTTGVNLRPFVWNRNSAHALSVASGYATGRWASPTYELPGLGHRSPEDRALDHHYVNDPAHWFHLDVGYELRSPSGLSLRAAQGLAKMLNPRAATCEDRRDVAVVCGADGDLRGDDPRDPIYVVAVSIGYAF